MLATTQHFNTALLSSRGIQILRDSKSSARDTTLLIPCASPYYNLVILCMRLSTQYCNTPLHCRPIPMGIGLLCLFTRVYPKDQSWGHCYLCFLLMTCSLAYQTVQILHSMQMTLKFGERLNVLMITLCYKMTYKSC